MVNHTNIDFSEIHSRVHRLFQQILETNSTSSSQINFDESIHASQSLHNLSKKAKKLAEEGTQLFASGKLETAIIGMQDSRDITKWTNIFLELAKLQNVLTKMIQHDAGKH